MHYRHGDVFLRGKEEIPQGAEKVEHEGGFVVERGEATGHHHTLKTKPKEAEVYKDENGDMWLKLNTPTEISHPEHDAIKIEPGVYKKEIEREYDPFQNEIRKVMD